jgi:hypothetical protein
LDTVFFTGVPHSSQNLALGFARTPHCSQNLLAEEEGEEYEEGEEEEE